MVKVNSYDPPMCNWIMFQEEGIVCASTKTGDYGVNDFSNYDETDISGLWDK